MSSSSTSSTSSTTTSSTTTSSTTSSPRPQSPLKTAGWWSLITFSWVGSLFWKRGNITEDDLWELLPIDTSQYAAEQLRLAWKQEEEKEMQSKGNVAYGTKKPSYEASLGRAYLHAFAGRYALISSWIIIKAVFVLGATQLLGNLLTALSDPTTSSNDLYILVFLFVLVTMVGGQLHHLFFFQAWREGMHWKAAAQTLIFEKSLVLRLDALAGVTSGRIINLAATDLERFQKLAQMGVYLFLAPLESAIIVWLLWREVGVGTLGGIGVLILLVGIQSAFSRIFGSLRATIASITDSRVKSTGQVISGIRVMKMYGWEPAFAKTVSNVRAKEMEKVRFGAFLRGINEGVFTASQVVIGAVTFFTAWSLGHQLSPRNVFVTLSLFSFLTIETTKFFVVGVEGLAECKVSIVRIQAYLSLPEVTNKAPQVGEEEDEGEEEKGGASGHEKLDECSVAVAVDGSILSIPKGAIEVENLTCSWAVSSNLEAYVAQKKQQKNATQKTDTVAVPVTTSTLQAVKSTQHQQQHSPTTLNNITLSVVPGSLCAVVGPVGCGKSSLLMALLGELSPSSSSSSSSSSTTTTTTPVATTTPVRVRGRIAYAAQNPWITTASIRENIVFGLPFDQERYTNVLFACCLQEDIVSFEHGDETIIGERGVNLSGGQRARLSLARACYLNADIYLLDDPLSAVDARVGRQLISRCIQGFLASKTRVLVTHQLQFLEKADNVIVMNNGKVVMTGSFSTLAQAYQQQQRDVVVANSGNESSTNSNNRYQQQQGAGGGDAGEMQHDAGEALRELFAAAKGTSSSSTTDMTTEASLHERNEEEEEKSKDQDEEKLADTPLPNAMKEGIGGEDSITALPPPPSSSSPPVVSSLTDNTEKHSSATTVLENTKTNNKNSSPSTSGLVQVETMEQGGVKAHVFLRYWAAGGGKLMVFYLFTMVAAASIAFMLSGVYLALWANASSHHREDPVIAATYGGLVALSMVLSLWRSVAFFRAAIQASAKLHDAAFTHVLRAHVLFFDANPAGRILNRLSKDIGLMDDFLPLTAFDFFATLFLCIAVVALVCAIAPWILLATAPLAVIFFYLRRYYMLTSRTVKRIEAVTRSPVFSLMGECLNGLPVIRAGGLQTLLIKRYRAYADANLRAYFVFLATSRWLGVRLDALCFALLIVTAFVAAALRDTISPALVGLSLTYVTAITNAFQWMVRQSSEYENAMVSVERVLEYADLQGEDVDLSGVDPTTLELVVRNEEEEEEEEEEDARIDQSDKIETSPSSSTSSSSSALSSSSSPNNNAITVVTNPHYKHHHTSSTSTSNNTSKINKKKKAVMTIKKYSTPTSWPNTGGLVFKNLWMRYRPELYPVLRGFSVVIPPGSRCGVVGRTGAGKSSLFMALLRLVEPLQHPLPREFNENSTVENENDANSGANSGGCGIIIDGIDISRIHLTRLRRAISVIPQDPVLFAGTIRSNLDPFDEHDDASYEDALQRVQLLPYVQSRGGLGAPVNEGGSNLSVGQRQLLCLARAVLRRNKVLLMDEASANVDVDTDSLLQSAVRHAFTGATILTIAHRLVTIIDYDYVLVVDDGKVTEFGPPADLLTNGTQGPFYSLVNETGRLSALTKAALEAAEMRRAKK